WAQVGGTGGHRLVALVGTGSGTAEWHRWVHCWAQVGHCWAQVGALLGTGWAGLVVPNLRVSLLGTDHQGTDHQCPDDRCRIPALTTAGSRYFPHDLKA
ncbi:unnamed protein product, partial [Staurois parvus]